MEQFQHNRRGEQMVSKTRILLMLLVCLVGLSGAVANSTRANSQAEVLPLVPNPAGFVEGSALSAEIQKTGTAGQLPSVKLIGVYYQPETLSKILKQGYYSEPAPMCQAHVEKEFSSVEEARQYFNELVANAKKEGAKKFDRNEPAIDRILTHYEKAADDLDTGEHVSLNGISNLGDIAETDTYYASSSIISYSLTDKKHTWPVPYAGSLGWIRIGRQILSIGALYPLVDKQSILSANDTLMTWLKDIVKHNQAL